MQKNQQAGADLILENRQVLLIFFGIVALCGVFFALGYVVGRNTFSPSVSAAPGEADNAGAGYKPSAMPPPAYLNRPPAAATTPAGPSDAGTDLNFYQSVEQTAPDATFAPPESSATPPAAATAAKPAEPEPPIPPGILIQVSALSRREDADALVALLKERKLPVLITSGTNDPFFHVVVGPYKTDKEAQQAKTLLEQDGFHPILKR
jgi:cell division septation protein DedD